VSGRAEALSGLCLHLNRAILESAGRAHLTAAFLGVLDSESGMLSYINAGHVPGLLLAGDSAEFLESTGLPLGLFPHATHEACSRVIPRGGALLMANSSAILTDAFPVHERGMALGINNVAMISGSTSSSES